MDLHDKKEAGGRQRLISCLQPLPLAHLQLFLQFSVAHEMGDMEL